MSAAAVVEPASKRPKLGPKLRIATHSGTFHADEALAVHLVRKLPEYKDADLIRTRDPVKLNESDIVLDVGGTYIPAEERYDHHQRGFNEVFGQGYSTKLSSAGLVYKHFGKTIIAQHLGLTEEDVKVPILYKKVYEEFVEGLDGIDNGVSQYEATTEGVEVRSKYKNRTDLSSRIARLNPAWNEPYNDQILDNQFEIASALAGKEFFGALDHYAKAWLPARELVEAAFNSRSPDLARVLIFDSSTPWKDHLFTIEKEQNVSESDQVLYVLYPDESGKWRIQAVPKTPESFQSRKALPEPWQGLRDEELSVKTGVPGCIFIHASGFIGGHQNKEGALELVKMALDF